MKYLFFVITLLFHVLAIHIISSVFDNTGLLLMIICTVLFAGAFMLVHPTIKRKIIKDIGWGMTYGSVLIIVAAFGFFLFFAFNFFNIS